jgi:superfamily II helicase
MNDYSIKKLKALMIKNREMELEMLEKYKNMTQENKKTEYDMLNQINHDYEDLIIENLKLLNDLKSLKSFIISK